MTKKEMLLAAEHQLLGFFHAHRGYSLEHLVTSMGLTLEEYYALRDSGAIAQLSDADRAEIFMIVTSDEK
jgi:hypothetical protein